MKGVICGYQTGEFKGRTWCKASVLEEKSHIDGYFGHIAYEAKVSGVFYAEHKDLLEEAIKGGVDVDITFDRYGRIVDIR